MYLNLTSLFRRNKIVEYLDTIVACIDKLLTQWHINNKDPTYIHLNMVKKTQQILIDTFGLIGFDYDLHTLDDKDDNSTIVIFTQLPEVIGCIYLFFNLQYRQARKIIDQYLN